MIQAHWLLIAILVVIALLLAIWLFGRASRQVARNRPRQHRPDVLDEGAAPAQRNQALIDAPPAIAQIVPTVAPSTTVDPMGGLGDVLDYGAPQGAADAGEPAWREAESVPEPQLEAQVKPSRSRNQHQATTSASSRESAPSSLPRCRRWA